MKPFELTVLIMKILFSIEISMRKMLLITQVKMINYFFSISCLLLFYNEIKNNNYKTNIIINLFKLNINCICICLIILKYLNSILLYNTKNNSMIIIEYIIIILISSACIFIKYQKLSI